MTDRTWYFLTVVPTSEFETAEKLHRLGATTIVPMFVTSARVARHKLVDREFPLWPGYVCAGFTTSRPWFQIDRISTITGALGWDGEPYALPAHTVDLVAETARKKLDLRRKTSERRALRIGDRVKLLTGPFINHVAEVSAVRKKSVQVLLEFFGAVQEVQIPASAVEQAAA
jgi:transcription antitermination factor NusG